MTPALHHRRLTLRGRSSRSLFRLRRSTGKTSTPCVRRPRPPSAAFPLLAAHLLGGRARREGFTAPAAAAGVRHLVSPPYHLTLPFWFPPFPDSSAPQLPSSAAGVATAWAASFSRPSTRSRPPTRRQLLLRLLPDRPPLSGALPSPTRRRRSCQLQLGSGTGSGSLVFPPSLLVPALMPR
jgi:hypothetical protein